MSWLLLLAAVDPRDVVPTDYLGPVFSAIATYGLLLAVPLAVACAALLKARDYRRRAAAAEEGFRPDAPLRPGRATLFGKVEPLPGAEHAVRVEIEQQGSEAESSGSWSHSWRERDRRMKVNPFLLQHASGRRVRVEPHREVLLVDAMDGVIRVSLTERVRVAELTPGEAVYAYGELEERAGAVGADGEGGAYREAPRGLVLRPPRSGRMLLSTEPLGRRFLRRAQLHRSAARTFLGALLLYHVGLLAYHLRTFAGTTVQAQISGLHHYTSEDSEGDETQHYEVKLELPGGARFDDEVSARVFAALHVGDALPVRRSPIAPGWLSNVGPGATVHTIPTVLAGVVWLLLLIGYAATASERRWYEGERLNEGGGGKLEETLWSGEESRNPDA